MVAKWCRISATHMEAKRGPLEEDLVRWSESVPKTEWPLGSPAVAGELLFGFCLGKCRTVRAWFCVQLGCLLLKVFDGFAFVKLQICDG